MELSQHGFLEELLQAQRRDHHTWATLPTGVNDFFSNGWSFDSFDETASTLATPSNPSFTGGLLSSATNEPTPSFDCPFTDHHQTNYPFVDTFTVPEMDTPSYTKNDHYPSLVDQDEDQFGLFGSFEERRSDNGGCKLDVQQGSNNVQVFNAALCGEKKTSGAKSRKLEGQPSKNLMAERRRRKRLNERLSMLRSIVPKISKMDRTSILGDTIDYVKELLERVNKLQEEESGEGTNQMSLVRLLKENKPNEALVRNSPKFNVERREMDTRIDICCATKPGLLLSTVSSLEALGLEIQQCVISCFNDFSMQASCSEEDEQRTLVASEDLKQALLRTAGYGGRYL